MELPPEVCAFHGAVMREVMSRLSGSFQEHRLSPAQVSALFRLRVDGATPVSRIGAELGLTSGTTSHLVDQLARRGLVRRGEHETDRRQRPVELTPAGAAFLDAFDRELDHALRTLLAPVSDDALADLAAALRRVLAALDRPGRRPA